VAAAVSPRVLIIENDFLIGEMIHDMVRGLGYTVTRTVHRVPSALREIGKENFDAALVNIGIDEQNHGEDIADILMEMGVSFGFVTGYNHVFNERHAHVPLLQKPFNEHQLGELLEALVGPARAPDTTPHAA
jgi:two-component SAPR family response regulator